MGAVNATVITVIGCYSSFVYVINIFEPGKTIQLVLVSGLTILTGLVGTGIAMYQANAYLKASGVDEIFQQAWEESYTSIYYALTFIGFQLILFGVARLSGFEDPQGA